MMYPSLHLTGEDLISFVQGSTQLRHAERDGYVVITLRVMYPSLHLTGKDPRQSRQGQRKDHDQS